MFVKRDFGASVPDRENNLGRKMRIAKEPAPTTDVEAEYHGGHDGARPSSTAQRVAAKQNMIDSAGPSSRRKSSLTGSDAVSEEARLRQQAIGVKLRHMFDEVVNEPVPDEFLEILRRADRSTGGTES